MRRCDPAIGGALVSYHPTLLIDAPVSPWIVTLGDELASQQLFRAFFARDHERECQGMAHARDAANFRDSMRRAARV
jgi:hypothetical protein